MKLVLVCVQLAALLLTPAPAAAAEVLREATWDRGPLLAGQRLTTASGAAGLRVSGPGRSHVLTLDRPGVTTLRYAVVGRVRHQGVEQRGHLELWSVFPDDRRYFSRGLAPHGPMQALSGDSGWRPFVLPFQLDPSGSRPTRLELHVVLPGAGTVDLGPVKLVQLEADEDPLQLGVAPASDSWWTGPTAGRIGALAGSLLGLLGALIGVLAARGRARAFVLGATRALVVVGLVSAGLGLWALLSDQPYAVYFPLLLVGLIGVVVPAGLLPGLRRRYQELELRRMRAMDA